MIQQGCNETLAIVGAKETTNCLQVLTAVRGQEEQHSLESNDWMYWELNVQQEAATVLVQLNRSAGDPVLFLKPAGAGFLVSPLQPERLESMPESELTCGLRKMTDCCGAKEYLLAGILDAHGCT